MRRRLLGEQGGVRATLIGVLDTKVGDIACYDTKSDAVLFYRINYKGEDIIKKYCIPVGVVVIPSSNNVYGNYSCGVMSLKLVSKNASWGNNYPTGYMNVVCYSDTPNGTVDGINGFGHFSDNGYYFNNEYYIPSAVLSDGNLNPEYVKQTAPSSSENALSYFGESIANLNVGMNNFGAIVDCANYYPEGTAMGGWYLPTIAEMGYLTSVYSKVDYTFNEIYSTFGLKVEAPGRYGFYNKNLLTSSASSNGSVWVINNMFKAELIDYTNAYGNAYAFIQLGGLQKNYGDIFISGGTVSDIPASGGSSQVIGYTYSQTYGYGDSTTNGGTITTGADIEVTSVSADNLGTTEKERTKIGDSVLTVTMNGKSTTASYEVYQQANVRSVSGISGGAYSYGNISAGSISNATIGAGGGSATAYAGNGSQSWSRTAITTNYSYTSGATSSAVTTAASSGTNSVAPSASSYTASANSKGTNVSGVTTVGSKYITWSANGKSTGGTMYVYQAANAITSYSLINSSDKLAYLSTSISIVSGVTKIHTGDGTGNKPYYLWFDKNVAGVVTFTVTNLVKATYTSGASNNVNKSGTLKSLHSDVVVSGSYPTYTITINAGSKFTMASILSFQFTVTNQTIMATTILGVQYRP